MQCDNTDTVHVQHISYINWLISVCFPFRLDTNEKNEKKTFTSAPNSQLWYLLSSHANSVHPFIPVLLPFKTNTNIKGVSRH